MNLTVKAALENCEQGARDILSTVNLHDNLELHTQLESLQATASGCLSMLSDLTQAYESLKAGGFTQEWFDVVNKDNNFLTVTNIELPKFFGGDQAKYDACEAGIIDTVKVWAEKAADMIRRIIAFIFKCIGALLNFWGREKGGSRTRLQMFSKFLAGKYGQYIANPYNDAVQKDMESKWVKFTARDIDVINRYLGRIILVADAINDLDIDVICMDPAQKSGNYSLEIVSEIVNKCYTVGIQPDPEYNGFEMNSNGITFTQPTSIAEREYVLDCRPVIDQIMQSAKDVADHIDRVTKVLNDNKTFAADCKRNFDSYLKQLKSNPNAVPNRNPGDYVAAIKRLETVISFISGILQHVTKLSIEYNGFMSKWADAFTSWSAKNP